MRDARRPAFLRPLALKTSEVTLRSSPAAFTRAWANPIRRDPPRKYRQSERAGCRGAPSQVPSRASRSVTPPLFTASCTIGCTFSAMVSNQGIRSTMRWPSVSPISLRLSVSRRLSLSPSGVILRVPTKVARQQGFLNTTTRGRTTQPGTIRFRRKKPGVLRDKQKLEKTFPWRRGGDSNPRRRDYRRNGFRDRRIQPLCHLSAREFTAPPYPLQPLQPYGYDAPKPKQALAVE